MTYASLLCLILLAPSLGTPAQKTPANKKEQKRESGADYYARWVDLDAAYIITDEERSVFSRLTTDEERDQFIEQFWLRRDPDPKTPENEFKEEHYRRIQYANQTYHAGIPGWKTDRGRVYIMFGKPDRLTTYPAGGSYQRKPHEGGGWTSVYPFEVWEYRHLDGVGDDIELEFVNDAGGNLYRLTMDPQDKDELLHVPSMGLTDAELYNRDFNGQKSFARVNRIREGGDAYNQGNYLERIKDQPFQRQELLMRISKAPPIRFNDLKEKVAASITYNLLPFRVASHYLQIDAKNFVVPVTLSFEHGDLSFKDEGELLRSRLQIYGLVSTMTKRTAFEFDDEIVTEYPRLQDAPDARAPAMYQRRISLIPGRYKLDLIVKDTISGKMGTLAMGLEIPSSADDRLGTSSLILTRNIETSGDDPNNPYVIGSFKIKPQVDRVFTQDDSLGFYLETYNFKFDEATKKPSLQIKYGFSEPGQEPGSMKPVTFGVTFLANRAHIIRMVQLRTLSKGKHDLVLSITDTLSGQSITARAPFEVK